ncbi:MAG: methylated-DNA--[protein]-cysteine S-methyltransferase [Pyrinomonadaceae bacterium]|nr:methylated-DNA--[protein]-cysteine S-methyltransferase [Pyrinomonadaceae bacterium]
MKIPDSICYQAVVEKNRNFDGVFFTCVTTTKIYCKAFCPARTPKRENVFFVQTCEMAETKGFRACLRCKPKNIAYNPNAEIALRVVELIESNATTNVDENLSMEGLSAKLNLSPTHLQRIFKDVFGITPKQFCDAQRLESFKREVQSGSNVTNALYASGYNSSRALYEKAVVNLGMTPAIYKKGGANVTINYAIVECGLGKMLVAATAKGVCSVKFADDEAELQSKLKSEFANAIIETNVDENLKNYVEAILRQLDGERRQLDIPQDVRATTFQIKVWHELRKIPFGETRSYKQIAETLGNAKAVRAVARACATNPVAIVNPCHRVIASNGELSGYAWGIERKKRLLELEKAANEHENTRTE